MYVYAPLHYFYYYARRITAYTEIRIPLRIGVLTFNQDPFFESPPLKATIVFFFRTYKPQEIGIEGIRMLP